ncbi:sensor histidine kinase [Pyxidicoccus xibeiensis]|uniref:sensor histidine kinase n=1 Tax=Pyxidicoccus xibeiensis TaxID=2906759 RepID=UPI0020A6EE8C|nr:HAMP domain-containing sensor histidine kinase [Pyxidicoccus xibeiensis]MCP3143745.1 HAMP domain-containing histidine kinase [Pyxidicoccus xibeiensis]
MAWMQQVWTRRTIDCLVVGIPFEILTSICFAKLLPLAAWQATEAFVAVALVVFSCEELLLALLLRWALQPVERWRSVRGTLDETDAVIHQALLRAYYTPRWFTVAWGASWALALSSLPAVLALLLPERVRLGERELLLTGLIVLATVSAKAVVATPLFIWRLAPTTRELSLVARQRRLLTLPRVISFRRRLLVFTACLALTPTCWMACAFLAPSPTPGTMFLFTFTALVWAPMSAFLVTKAVSGQVNAIRKAVDGVVERSSTLDVGYIPVQQPDTLGDLAEGINSMVDQLNASAVTNQEQLVELDRLYRQAAEALRLRDEFLLVASHELKTPLTSLSLTLETMERKHPAALEEPKERLKRARRQVTSLIGLVDDLLDVGRIQQGHLELRQAPVSLGSLLAEVIASFRPLAPRHHLTLELPQGEVPVKGDAARLTQVFNNLLDNAIKYSPEGGAVRVKLMRGEGLARVSVSDEGVGIPAEQFPELFERFFRARTTTTKSFGGLGLGLYITRNLVERHGGRIDVQSEVDQGTTFVVTFPELREAQREVAFPPRQEAPSEM